MDREELQGCLDAIAAGYRLEQIYPCRDEVCTCKNRGPQRYCHLGEFSRWVPVQEAELHG